MGPDIYERTRPEYDPRQTHPGYARGQYDQDRERTGYGRGRYNDPEQDARGPHGLSQQPQRPHHGGHYGKGPKNWRRSDERLRESVSEALSDDDLVDATHIEVQVKDGEVTLTGTVEDRRMKRFAEDCVERVPGVRDVQNLLRIPDTSMSNDTASDRKARA